MKRLKLFFGFSLLFVLSASLSGCIITSASPDPGKTLFLESGESKLFQFRIEGPAETDTLYYKWEAINQKRWAFRPTDIVELKTQHGDNDFEFQPEFSGDIMNKIIISCDLRKVVSYEYRFCLQGSCETPGWYPNWATTDSKSWEIKIIQDPPIWNGDYIADDQEDLQLLNGFTEIIGDLTIADTGLTDLQGLNNLSSVGGNVYIYWNFNMVNLKGLDSLESIGGHLIINNTILDRLLIPTSLDGLDSLISVGGNLEISSNFGLKDLNALNNITSIGGGLGIGGNDGLMSLGLDSLNSIGGYFRIMGNDNLSTSLAENLRDRITISGSDIIICGNFDGDPCP